MGRVARLSAGPLSERLSQSRLSRITGTKQYQNMTIRNWNTTTKLLSLLDERGRRPVEPDIPGHVIGTGC
ncbi:MAG: hypothetical protein F4Z64_06220 [Acidimicrobiaceae bacterium]|nr:hypothetical protein [Acidimicrobiaceae bacterium]MYE95933.1 hypothetical protein [Acidimicrobiaceae bacterium]